MNATGVTLLSLLLSTSFVEERVTVPLFGKIPALRPEPIRSARGVVLFVSGDGGWNLGVVDMARRMAPRALVVGLSLPAWRKMAERSPGSCWYPAGDLESIAKAVEKRYGFPRYLPPILVGYSSGATLVYGALAQSPESFAGAVSLGFCPDLEVARPFCGRGEWKPSYDSRKKTSLLPPRNDLPPCADGGPRWTALQGQIDQVCSPSAVAKFAAKIPAARVVSLPKVGHGFSVPRNWAAAYDGAIETLLQPVTAWQPVPAESHQRAGGPAAGIVARLEALDLPLQVEWPEDARAAVLFLSGDGGWAELDREVAKRLSLRGIAVVGWNSLHYFWNAKTPETFRADLARVLDALPEDVRVFAGGYSFGAEVVPVTLAERPAALSRVAGMVLVGPGRYASFEVSPLDWIRTDEAPTPHSVRKAIESNPAERVLCLESSEAADSGCPAEKVSGVTRVTLPGGHHFSGDFDGIARRISESRRRRVREVLSPRRTYDTIPADMKHAPIVEAVRAALEPLWATERFRLLVVFGSIARGTGSRESDLDLAFLPKNGVDETWVNAEVVRLTHENDVDVVDLTHADPLLAMEVARTGVLLFCDDPSDFTEFRSLAFRRYVDTEKLRRARRRTLDLFQQGHESS